MLRAAVLALTIGLAGCAASRPGWLGGTPAAGETFYASVAGLAVHEEASGSSAVVGRLALHERVTRSEVAHGYAHVVGASGVAGWVDNAKLAWRLPPPPTERSTTKTAPATRSPGAAAPNAGTPAAPTPAPARPAAASESPAAPSTAGTAAVEGAPAAVPAAAPSPASAPGTPTAVPATDTPPPTTPAAHEPPRPYDPF